MYKVFKSFDLVPKMYSFINFRINFIKKTEFDPPPYRKRTIYVTGLIYLKNFYLNFFVNLIEISVYLCLWQKSYDRRS